ncbi:MAG: hypothetical protein IPJ34_43515 [Myxococcales bacterium]|nr:hypothetical protein [Myxococcales bacterium]
MKRPITATLVGAASALLALTVAATAEAFPQRRDYFLDPPRGGTFVHADLITVGAQVSLERRQILEDETMSNLNARVSALYSLGYADVAGHLDVRLLFLTIGASAGVRRVNRTYTGLAAPDGFLPEVTSEQRREKDKDSKDATSWNWAEARARLVIPLEPLWLVTNLAMRWEGQPDNTYDWFHTNVHDGGRLLRFDATMFVRAASFGGLGPTVRVLDMPQRGKRVTEVAYGLTFGTRPGVFRKDDLFLFQTLVRPGDNEFGFHITRLPAYVMLIYRASFEL